MNWPRISRAAAFRKAGPAPHWGSTVELTLLMEIWGRWPRECEYKRQSRAPHLSYGDVDKREVPLCPSKLVVGGGAIPEVTSGPASHQLQH